MSHKLEAGGKHPLEKPSRTLFVRNINYDATESEIREIFEKYGVVQDVFSIIETRGMVFVTFSDIRHAEEAMKQLQKTMIRGRSIDIHYSLPRDVNDKFLEPSKHYQNDTLFVTLRGSSGPILNKDIRDIFGEYGDIKDIRDCPKSSGNRQKFVEFYDVRACKTAMEKVHNTSFKGGILDIKYAIDRKRDRDTRSRSPSPRRGSRGTRDAEPVGPVRRRDSSGSSSGSQTRHRDEPYARSGGNSDYSRGSLRSSNDQISSLQDSIRQRGSHLSPPPLSSSRSPYASDPYSAYPLQPPGPYDAFGPYSAALQDPNYLASLNALDPVAAKRLAELILQKLQNQIPSYGLPPQYPMDPYFASPLSASNTLGDLYPLDQRGAPLSGYPPYPAEPVNYTYPPLPSQDFRVNDPMTNFDFSLSTQQPQDTLQNYPAASRDDNSNTDASGKRNIPTSTSTTTPPSTSTTSSTSPSSVSQGTYQLLELQRMGQDTSSRQQYSSSESYP